MSTGLDTTVTLVTGGNRGIGLETVRRLVAAGHRVYLGARNAVRGEAEAADVGAGFVQLDVTSDDSVERAAWTIEEEAGVLDVLVNNAGISGPLVDPHDYTADDATQVLLTNFVGYVRTIHAFLPLLERSSAPRIVNVSSGLGSFGLFHNPDRIESRFGSPLYGASKAAINMLTARYARLLPGIRVNAADPGMTATDLSHGEGHSLREGTDAVVALALDGPGGPSGTFRDRHGDLPF